MQRFTVRDSTTIVATHLHGEAGRVCDEQVGIEGRIWRRAREAAEIQIVGAGVSINAVRREQEATSILFD